MRLMLRPMLAKLLCGAVVFGLSATASAGEKVTLSATPAAGETRAVSVSLEVGGDLLLSEAPGDSKKLKMSVNAQIKYDERLIDVAGDNRRALRHYDQTAVKLKIDKGQLEPVLDDAHRLIAVETGKDFASLFSPQTPLTRDELDLIDVPANTAVLDRLLPAEAVEVGEGWKPGTELLGLLLGLDKVSASDVELKLTDANADTATIEGSGHVDGAIDGVASETELKLKLTVDRRQKMITTLSMAIQENRSIGHVAAGLDVVARLAVNIRPIAQSATLTDELIAEPWSEDPSLQHLAYQSELGKYRLLFDRRWHILDEGAQLLVLRLIDKGELVAQCNVTPLAPTTQGKTISPEAFQADIQKVLGESFEQFIHAEEWTNDRQTKFVHVIASGKVNDLPIQWHYYLATSAGGRHLSFAFTVEGDLVERFAGEDRPVVESLVIEDSVETTQAETPVQR